MDNGGMRASPNHHTSPATTGPTKCDVSLAIARLQVREMYSPNVCLRIELTKPISRLVDRGPGLCTEPRSPKESAPARTVFARRSRNPARKDHGNPNVQPSKEFHRARSRPARPTSRAGQVALPLLRQGALPPLRVDKKDDDQVRRPLQY